MLKKTPHNNQDLLKDRLDGWKKFVAFSFYTVIIVALVLVLMAFFLL